MSILVIDNCAGNPCLNNGTCSNGINSFTCQCAPGFTGAKCELSKQHNSNLQWLYDDAKYLPFYTWSRSSVVNIVPY